MTSGIVNERYPGRTPRQEITADMPTCHLCSWAVSHGKFWLKYINRSCLEHRDLPAVQDRHR